VKRRLRWITDHFGWKLLALAIAVLIWVLVASEPELSTFVNVRLEYKNLPEDLVISSEPVTTISLELRGPSGELRGVSFGPAIEGGMRPAVILDMSGVQPGERTFAIGDGNVRLPRGVHLVRAVPSEVRLDFERRAVREVQVVPRFTGEGANGYVVAEYSVEPQKLEIGGPASRVEGISSVVTDPVDVSGVVGTSEFRVNAYVGDPFVRFRGSPAVTVSVVMKRKQAPGREQPRTDKQTRNPHPTQPEPGRPGTPGKSEE
jgi:YbbR-like protein